MPESIQSSRFVSHRARTSGEFDSRKDSQSTNFEQRPQIFVKLSFRELCHSKLSGLHAFDNMEFVEDLKATFKKSKNRNKHIIICSDFNYDLFEYEHNGHINGFLNNISSNLLQPRIMKPKRIVKYNRPSLVDYICVNIYDKENHSGNIIDKITDHLPNFGIIRNMRNKLQKQKFKIRNI